MKIQSLLAAVLIVGTLSASARIGENPEQLDTRYGKPFKLEKDGSRVYVKNGFTIIAIMRGGKATGLAVQKIAKDIIGQPEAITGDEIEIFLKASGGGKEWKLSNAGGFGSKSWTLDGDQIQASYDMLKKTLVILTIEELKAQADEIKRAKEKELEGF